MNLKEHILLYSTNIFKYYFGSFKIGRLYKSPFRDETNPSFNLFYGKRGVLLFKDFGYKSGNAIDFVMAKYNIKFREAIDKIINDLVLPMPLDNKTKDREYNEVKMLKVKDKEHPILQPIVRVFNGVPMYTEEDKKFWLRDLKIKDVRYLYKHKIYSARELLINNFRVWSSYDGNPIYIYPEKYKGIWYYKAYKPKEKNKKDKWRSSYVDAARMIHNLAYLDYKREDLIITKSVKDCTILDSIGFNVCNTQGEDIPIPLDIVHFLKSKFKDIRILYDCDFEKQENTGYKLAEKLANDTGFEPIFIPEEYKCTDSADLIQKFQRETVKNLINLWK